MNASRPRRKLSASAVLIGAATVLYLRVLLGILAEYRWYFPANFEHSAFLSGKQLVFHGLYAAAFYAHALSGPAVSLLALFLFLSGRSSRLRPCHRIAGRLLTILVMAMLIPSGLIMARDAYAGPIAGAAFIGLAATTGLYLAFTVYFARRKQFADHRRFAIGTFVLLASPLVLRLASGVAIVGAFESELYYQLNAWLSWLLPLAIYESGVARSNVVRNLFPEPGLVTAKEQIAPGG